MKNRIGQNLFLAVVVVGAVLVVGYLVLFYDNPGRADGQVGPSRFTLSEIPFDGAQAYRYLEKLCEIGPRPSGSEGMQAQQKLLTEHFQQLGAEVHYQRFRARHPQNGSAVTMANLIVQWHPDRKQRILLCAHYDTRPFPDQDPVNPQGTFVGANDGASGVALLMELGKAMPKLKGEVGVDFVLFDGEEFVFRERDSYFLGSEWFSRDYAAHPPKHRYRWGVLLDMIGDGDLQIYQEKNSVAWRDTRPLVNEIWNTAKRLGVSEFVPRTRYELRDDHLSLHNLAKIPTCDVIDFDYPAWHTQGDTAQRCSAVSLAKVGWVLQEWLSAAMRK